MPAPPKPKGMHVRPEEYDMLSHALIAMAKEAEKHQQPQAARMVRQFVVRMKQAVFEGQGVDDETLRRMLGAVEAGFARSDFKATKVAVAALIAAVVRQEPDPGHTIGRVLAPAFVDVAHRSATAQGAKLSAVALRNFQQRIESERGAAPTSATWKEPQKAFEYIVDLLQFCAEELDQGLDPFTETSQDSH